MATGVRVFFFDEDGTITRIPTTRFCRALDGEPALPEYVGERIRYAIVSVELEDRKPVEVRSIGYQILLIDDEGRVDQAWLEYTKRAASETLGQALFGTGAKTEADRKVISLPLPETPASEYQELRLIYNAILDEHRSKKRR
jgi:hypothetical protein